MEMELEIEYPEQGSIPALPKYVSLVDRKGNIIERFGGSPLIGGGSGAVGSAKRPVHQTVTLAANNTEYSLVLPRYPRALEFQCRTANDIRFSFDAGEVLATDYFTLKSGTEYYKEELVLENQVIYFATAASAPLIVEVIIWE